MQNKVLILDFGSQYTQLIARRVRELFIYCEIYPYNNPPKNPEEYDAVILSGSPYSVRSEEAPHPDLSRIRGKLPLLAGAQSCRKTACHQSNGMGASGRFPPLNGTDWVTGDKERLVHLILNGMEGEIKVNGEIYDGLMPQHSFLNDDQIADVLSYIRTHFGNLAGSVTAEEVEKYRKTNIN